MDGITKTVGVVFLARSTRSVVAIVGLVAFIALLGPSGFGVFVLFQAILTLAGLLVNAGINDAVEKRLSETRDARILPTALAIKAIVAIPVIGLVVAFSPVLDSYLSAGIALWLIPAVVCRQFGRVSLNALRGELRVSEATLIELVQQLAFVGLGVGLILSGYGITSLLLALIISWGGIGIVTISRLQTPASLPSVEIAGSLLEFAKYNVVASLLTGSAYNWADTLVLGVFVSPAAVAAYEAAWQVSAAVMLLSGSISTAIFPHVSDLNVREQQDETEALIPRALFGSVLLVIPALIGVAIISNPLLTLVFDPTIGAAATALTILMVGRLAESSNQVVGRVLLAIDRPQLVAQSTVVFLVLNIGMNVLLIPAFGLTGAAAATAASMIVFTTMNAMHLRRFVSIRVPTHAIGSCVLAAVLMGMALTAVVSIIAITTHLHLIVAVLGAAALYGVVVLSLPPSSRLLDFRSASGDGM